MEKITKQKGRVSRCNGLTLPLHPYSIFEKNLFDQLVEQVRIEFCADMSDRTNFQGEVYYGDRCRSNDRVFSTIQSAATAEQFKAEPLTWIYDALQNCAERDWWYIMDGVMDSRSDFVDERDE